MQLVKGVQLGHSEDCIKKERKYNRDLGDFKSLLEGTVKGEVREKAGKSQGRVYLGLKSKSLSNIKVVQG